MTVEILKSGEFEAAHFFVVKNAKPGWEWRILRKTGLQYADDGKEEWLPAMANGQFDSRYCRVFKENGQ